MSITVLGFQNCGEPVADDDIVLASGFGAVGSFGGVAGDPPAVVAAANTAVTTQSGEPVTLSVVASGLNLFYAWYLNGTLINNSNANSITFPTPLENVETVYTYRVDVTNVNGTVSQEFVVTVTPPSLFPRIDRAQYHYTNGQFAPNFPYVGPVNFGDRKSGAFRILTENPALFYQWEESHYIESTQSFSAFQTVQFVSGRQYSFSFCTRELSIIRVTMYNVIGDTKSYEFIRACFDPEEEEQ